MTDVPAWLSDTADGLPARPSSRGSSANLADVLERVLDKGMVIAGDIRINLLDIELLTIKLRLLIASVDKAKEMGINWWEHDPTLTAAPRRPTLPPAEAIEADAHDEYDQLGIGTDR